MCCHRLQRPPRNVRGVGGRQGPPLRFLGSTPRSETVVPILDGATLGVLVIDAPEKNRFDKADRIALELFVQTMIPLIGWNQFIPNSASIGGMGRDESTHAREPCGFVMIFEDDWGTFPVLTGTPALLREEIRKRV